MNAKSSMPGMPLVQRPVAQDERGQPARPEHNHPVPVEEFDRERMGIAAKE